MASQSTSSASRPPVSPALPVRELTALQASPVVDVRRRWTPRMTMALIEELCIRFERSTVPNMGEKSPLWPDISASLARVDGETPPTPREAQVKWKSLLQDFRQKASMPTPGSPQPYYWPQMERAVALHKHRKGHLAEDDEEGSSTSASSSPVRGRVEAKKTAAAPSSALRSASGGAPPAPSSHDAAPTSDQWMKTLRWASSLAIEGILAADASDALAKMHLEGDWRVAALHRSFPDYLTSESFKVAARSLACLQGKKGVPAEP